MTTIIISANVRKHKHGGDVLIPMERKIYSKVFSLVLPIALQNLLASLVSVSDALMLGRLDQNVLAAVSLATQVQFVLNLFFTALIAGTTILSAQYYNFSESQ